MKDSPRIPHAERKAAGRVYVQERPNPFTGAEVKVEPLVSRKIAKRAAAALAKTKERFAEIKELKGMHDECQGSIVSRLDEICENGQRDPFDIFKAIAFNEGPGEVSLGVVVDEKDMDKADSISAVLDGLGRNARLAMKLNSAYLKFLKIKEAAGALAYEDMRACATGISTKRNTDPAQLLGLGARLATLAEQRRLSSAAIFAHARRCGIGLPDSELMQILSEAHESAENAGGTLASMLSEFLKDAKKVSEERALAARAAERKPAQPPARGSEKDASACVKRIREAVSPCLKALKRRDEGYYGQVLAAINDGNVYPFLAGKLSGEPEIGLAKIKIAVSSAMGREGDEALLLGLMSLNEALAAK